ncbi:MAG: VanZ family protein [Chitinivibrionales bacterium]
MGKKKRIAFLLLAVILFVLPLFFEMNGFEEVTPLRSALLNFGHVPLFGVISLILLRMVSVLRSGVGRGWKDYLYAFLLSILLGVVTELIQMPLERDADISDFLLDLAGAAGFLSIAASRDRRLFYRHVSSRWLLLAGLALLLISTLPLVSLSVSLLYRSHSFPLICGFESRWADGLVETKDAYLTVLPTPAVWKENATSKTGHVRVIAGRKYPGIHIEQLNQDWSEYTHFAFDIFNPHNLNIPLRVRVHDRKHTGHYQDRYSRQFSISPGAHRVCIPLDSILNAPRNRLMRLDEIAGIVWFMSEPQMQYSYYIDNIMLTMACD